MGRISKRRFFLECGSPLPLLDSTKFLRTIGVTAEGTESTVGVRVRNRQSFPFPSANSERSAVLDFLSARLSWGFPKSGGGPPHSKRRFFWSAAALCRFLPAFHAAPATRSGALDQVSLIFSMSGFGIKTAVPFSQWREAVANVMAFR
jgi:hypothetical protein